MAEVVLAACCDVQLGDTPPHWFGRGYLAFPHAPRHPAALTHLLVLKSSGEAQEF